MKIRSIRKGFIFIFSFAKGYLFLCFIFSIILGLIPLVSVTIVQELVNTITSIISNDSNSYYYASLLLGFQFGVMLLGSIIKHLQEYYDQKVALRLEYKLGNKIFKKTNEVSYSNFDKPDFYNHLNRISNNSGSRFLSPINSVFNIFSACISMITLLGFLYSIHWMLLILSLLAFIPTLIIKSFFGNKQFWLQLMLTPVAREVSFIQRILTERNSTKEVRMFGLSKYFIMRWSKKFNENAGKSLHLLKKQKHAEIGLDGLTALFYVGAAFVIIWLTKKSAVKVGDFVAITQAVQSTQSSVMEVSNGLAKLYEDSLFIEDYFYFMDFSTESSADKATHNFPVPIYQGICFENVNFSYTNSEKKALNNISCKIFPGEKIAIVGNNGSGKTTLMKCLLGLYIPTSGKIYYDELEIREIRKESLVKNISVIFQDFIKYPFSISENIAFGKISGLYNFNEIERAAKKAGIHNDIQKFSKGYNTVLGKYIEDGENLSGGQWQKLAMARVLIKDSAIVVLDEPTAALDPQSELEVFRKFKQLTMDKTAFIISHRMAAAVVADRVMVMEDGRIIEFGTHDELLQKGGTYSDMYNLQASTMQKDRHVYTGVN